METRGILFLVLPASRVPKVQVFIDQMIVPSERCSVKILSDERAASFSTDVKSAVAQDLIDHLQSYRACSENRLLIDRDVVCSIGELTGWWETNAFGRLEEHKVTPKTMERIVKDHLEATGRHWRVHAAAQVKKFEGPSAALDGWLQQFAILGDPKIGRKIAAQLRVIPTGGLPSTAFRVHQGNVLGSRRANCYIQDDDEGGSWVEMQVLLTHACPPSSVFPVHWDENAGTITFPDKSVDEFVVHEDGLWSGHETVRRLRAIAATPPAGSVIFRFGVVTDFGLMVARQAIRSLGLNGKVSIDASASEVIPFLKDDLHETLHFGLEMPADDYYGALHDFVRSFAFSASGYWSPDEIRICEELGGQLVDRWLTQKDGKPPSKEKIQRYALGGGRFASTVLFSRSVPKVCLPLLWLDGPVTLGGKKVVWKPLFVDARRVSNEKLLLSPAKSAL